MVSFRDYVENKYGIKMPEGNISAEWFYNNDLPMIVRCSCCEMSMAISSAWIDEEGYIYCSDCADVSDD